MLPPERQLLVQRLQGGPAHPGGAGSEDRQGEGQGHRAVPRGASRLEEVRQDTRIFLMLPPGHPSWSAKMFPVLPSRYQASKLESTVVQEIPTDPFTNVEVQNPSHNIPELHKI